eukprot:PhF_6_TR30542/c0_g1_i3/m.44827
MASGDDTTCVEVKRKLSELTNRVKQKTKTCETNCIQILEQAVKHSRTKAKQTRGQPQSQTPRSDSDDDLLHWNCTFNSHLNTLHMLVPSDVELQTCDCVTALENVYRKVTSLLTLLISQLEKYGTRPPLHPGCGHLMECVTHLKEITPQVLRPYPPRVQSHVDKCLTQFHQERQECVSRFDTYIKIFIGNIETDPQAIGWPQWPSSFEAAFESLQVLHEYKPQLVTSKEKELEVNALKTVTQLETEFHAMLQTNQLHVVPGMIQSHVVPLLRSVRWKKRSSNLCKAFVASARSLTDKVHDFQTHFNPKTSSALYCQLKDLDTAFLYIDEDDCKDDVTDFVFIRDQVRSALSTLHDKRNNSIQSFHEAMSRADPEYAAAVRKITGLSDEIQDQCDELLRDTLRRHIKEVVEQLRKNLGSDTENTLASRLSSLNAAATSSDVWNRVLEVRVEDKMVKGEKPCDIYGAVHIISENTKTGHVVLQCDCWKDVERIKKIPLVRKHAKVTEEGVSVEWDKCRALVEQKWKDSRDNIIKAFDEKGLPMEMATAKANHTMYRQLFAIISADSIADSEHVIGAHIRESISKYENELRTKDIATVMKQLIDDHLYLQHALIGRENCDSLRRRIEVVLEQISFQRGREG